jgi:hypothetical protein
MLKPPRAISHVSVELGTNVSDNFSVVIDPDDGDGTRLWNVLTQFWHGWSPEKISARIWLCLYMPLIILHYLSKKEEDSHFFVEFVLVRTRILIESFMFYD